MPHYFSLGTIPPKRHIQFRKPDGGLYSEQLISTEGFSDAYSITYHIHPPTMVTSIDAPRDVKPEVAVDNNMQARSFQGFRVKPADDYLDSRIPVLTNSDLTIILAAPRQSMKTYFFKNSQASEMIFVHEGKGILHTMYGELPFKSGDHIMIPRGVIYQLSFDTSDNRLFIVESYSPLRFPKKYVNKQGQLEEHAPFCERDLRKPEKLVSHDEKGDFVVMVKKEHQLFPYHYASHPFDVVGWDGCLYPYTFSIHDFEPITGRIHQPPPVHQTFEGDNFVTCAFVPRLYDYHPLSIPVPYNHSNVDSDEVLYYVDGDFMSRKHVDKGQITLHPIGIPHGPHPGTVEKSLGARETGELAVMVDTFRPLHITRQAIEIEETDYFRSWLE
ncbi:MAG: homogentisate 1,2-dioxygenase [Lentimicrobium sp.]|jgi:homogentisate 1,2-dioxygenase|nr:homogentisate 1,2-dioxygenase [Lentimicrobium sp.]MDD2528354.1 homogentisate 1,2-dioxygenase [Lentimicrobiaceae bacterium]MDD4598505.1 homogentisate 1,2-dioxygenase [Lentimicrobiaceae bacterium]HAH59861.1 homogentisate 1,2-dioxygenase [Bacteroidales bacterium]